MRKLVNLSDAGSAYAIPVGRLNVGVSCKVIVGREGEKLSEGSWWWVLSVERALYPQYLSIYDEREFVFLAPNDQSVAEVTNVNLADTVLSEYEA